MTNLKTPITIQAVTVRPTARGVRIWLEDTANNARLSGSGFVKGARYDRIIKNGVITMTLNPEGKKKVSGKKHPIIDISAKKLEGLEAGAEVWAFYLDGEIIIGEMPQ